MNDEYLEILRNGTSQISRQDLDLLTPAEINTARRAGRLNDLLTGNHSQNGNNS